VAIDTPAGWTQRRQRVHDWLKRNAPSLAELYVGVVEMLYTQDPPIPGWSRFVAHAVREIRNRLPDAVAGRKVAERLDYVSRLDAIVAIWEPVELSEMIALNATADAAVTPGQTIGVKRRVYDLVSALTRAHLEARERPKEAAWRLFEALAPETTDQCASLEPTINQWLSITSWFQGNAHDQGKEDRIYDRDEYRRKFETCETTLTSLIQDFFKTTDELDKILEDTNT
jgi:hypothetical protein